MQPLTFKPISREELNVLSKVKYMPRHLDWIIKECGEPTLDVKVKLSSLILKGHVVEVVSDVYSRMP